MPAVFGQIGSGQHAEGNGPGKTGNYHEDDASDNRVEQTAAVPGAGVPLMKNIDGEKCLDARNESFQSIAAKAPTEMSTASDEQGDHDAG